MPKPTTNPDTPNCPSCGEPLQWQLEEVTVKGKRREQDDMIFARCNGCGARLTEYPNR